MILVWGFKNYVRLLGIITFVCGSCQNPAAQRVVERIRKFTFFWIPLFVVKRQTLVTCSFCGTVSVLDKEQTASLMVALEAARPAQPAATSDQQPAAEH